MMFKMSKIARKLMTGTNLQQQIRKISGYVAVDNGTLFYERHGLGSEAVLCIPGALGSTQSDFSYQLSEMSKDFTMVSFDPRGYGKSKKVFRDLSKNFYEDDAKDAVKVMEKLGFEKYSILGWSDGGMVGMIVAGMAPHVVNNLVVWGSNAFLTEKDKALGVSMRDLNKWSERMRKPMEDIYGKEGLEKLWHGWCDGYSAIDDVCCDSLPKIKCPTFILHGMKDPMLDSCHYKYLHENIKGSELYIFENGKHNIHMRYHAEFNELVTDFIKKNNTSKL